MEVMNNNTKPKSNKYLCTQCGVYAEVRYSNLIHNRVVNIVGEDERLCLKCFEKRINDNRPLPTKTRESYC